MVRSDQSQVDRATHTSSLSDYIRVVRRRKWIILLAVILVPLAAVLFSLQQERLYQSSSQVLLSNQNLPSALSGGQQPSGVNLTPDRVAQTQADLARVPQVAKQTLRAVGLKRSPGDLLAHSTVSTKQNADLLEFSVTDHDPGLATKLASAYALQFVKYRQQLDTASLQRARAELKQRIDALPAQTGLVYRSLVDKDQQLATLEALQTSNASVVEAAGAAGQVQPKPKRNAILGLALGLVAGLGLAFLWEALDTRVRSAEEIGERLGFPLLARLPEPSRRLREQEQLAMLVDPRGTDAEAFRMLRTNLEFVRMGHQTKTIMVTSSVQQEGKSTTVANLAVALARAGQRVCLVDLDLRRPFLDHFFGVRDQPGLTHVVIGQTSLDEALIPIAIGDLADRPRLPASDNGNDAGANVPRWLPSLHEGSLRLVITGPIPPNVGEFAGSAALGGILGELRNRFDTVLIDAPPTLQVGDAMALSSNVDALFVVARMNVVRRPMLADLRRQLEASPAYVLGFVVTAAEREVGYGGYGHGYGYSSRVQETRTEERATP